MQPVHVHHLGTAGQPHLVLLHGLSDSGACWPDAVRRWQADWDIHALDQRGHGQSPRFGDDELPRMAELWAHDVVDVLQGLDAPAVVVGHSLGGRMALRAALERPDLVRALVLEDPSITAWDQRGQQVTAEFGDFIDQVHQHTERHRLLARGGMPDVEIDPWVESKLQTDRRMVAQLDFGPMQAEQALNRVQAPTLLIAPQDSQIIGDPAAVTNPLVRFELRQGVGHTVRRDDPEAYHAIVDAFLAEHR